MKNLLRYISAVGIVYQLVEGVIKYRSKYLYNKGQEKDRYVYLSVCVLFVILVIMVLGIMLLYSLSMLESHEGGVMDLIHFNDIMTCYLFISGIFGSYGI